MYICSKYIYVNMQNNYVNMRGNYVNMQISHITCQHNYMLHVEIIYALYRRQRYTTIGYRCFWFYIIRPHGTKTCCDGEVWNISFQSCQRKWNQNYVSNSLVCGFKQTNYQLFFNYFDCNL